MRERYLIFGALNSLLFSVSLDSVLKTVPCPIMVYFNKLCLGWRVVSLALIPSSYRCGCISWIARRIVDSKHFNIHWCFNLNVFRLYQLVRQHMYNAVCWARPKPETPKCIYISYTVFCLKCQNLEYIITIFIVNIYLAFCSELFEAPFGIEPLLNLVVKSSRRRGSW